MHTALLGEFWHECARCGETFPEHLIEKNSRGHWICHVHCWDKDEDTPNFNSEIGGIA